jgi:DNA-binding transcriptional MerR regulator/effector-binding domain-containing protein
MFRIGEFSRIAQVSGRLLRFYDELGLLRPALTDPQTGYRYYSAEQLPQLNRILVLKELGLSLEQIARLVERDTSADELRGMLALRKAQIEQALADDLARLRRVESRLRQIETHGQVQEPDVVLKSVPALSFLAVGDVLADMGAVRTLVQQIVTRAPMPDGIIAVVGHAHVYEPDALDVEVGYVLTGKAPATLRVSDERVLTLRQLPAVETLATLVHVGRLDDVHQTYALLGAWLEQHGYAIGGDARELVMQLPNAAETVVIEIQLPVRWGAERAGR